MLTRSDSDDEDETAALMAELAKIKQERAEEKARQVSTASHHIARPVFSPLLAVIDLNNRLSSILSNCPHITLPLLYIPSRPCPPPGSS